MMRNEGNEVEGGVERKRGEKFLTLGVRAECLQRAEDPPTGQLFRRFIPILAAVPRNRRTRSRVSGTRSARREKIKIMLNWEMMRSR